MIDSIANVVIPVTDQDRAIDFYRALGLEVRADFAMGPGIRWVEVAPPGATTAIALAVPRGTMWGSVSATPTGTSCKWSK